MQQLWFLGSENEKKKPVKALLPVQENFECLLDFWHIWYEIRYLVSYRIRHLNFPESWSDLEAAGGEANFPSFLHKPVLDVRCLPAGGQ